MEYLPLGPTTTQIPKIGFGAWQYRGGGGVLRRAHELGAAFVDTAEAYGTEAQVARDIGDLRDEYFIATKVSPANLAYDDVLSHADASLERLATDRVDLYQVHHPNPDIPIPETMRAMRQLVSEGKVRFVGVSNYSVDDMKEAQDALGDVPLVANQVRYSLAARQIEADVLPFCQENGVTVVAFSPLVKGRFGDPALERLNEVSAEVGKTPAQVLLNWVIDRPGVMAIPKTDQVDRVDEAAGSVGWSLTADQRRRLTGD